MADRGTVATATARTSGLYAELGRARPACHRAGEARGVLRQGSLPALQADGAAGLPQGSRVDRLESDRKLPALRVWRCTEPQRGRSVRGAIQCRRVSAV